jgi:hypothetical protein
METGINESNVFRINWGKGEFLSLPNQVFNKSNFEFLLTIGGNLVDNEIEYQKLMTVLQGLGETDFFIVENIGFVETNNKISFAGKLSTNSDFDSFQKLGYDYDTYLGWSSGNFFIYGMNENWGIYICEYPTINVIGCDKKYAIVFRDVFGIAGDGFDELDEFVSKEFQQNPDLKQQLIQNYKLNPGNG